MGHRPYPSFFYKRHLADRDGDSQRGKQLDEITSINDWFTSLTGEEAISWAFGTRVSDIPVILWDNTSEDIESKIKLKLGFEQAKSFQSLQIFSLVASSALGGKKPKVEEVKDLVEAKAKFDALFSKKG